MQATTNQAKSVSRNPEPAAKTTSEPANVVGSVTSLGASPAPDLPEGDWTLKASPTRPAESATTLLTANALPSLIPSSAAILERLEVLDKERNLLRRLLKIAEAQEGAGE
ncbi:hypothetical protein [Singulisphaera sp. PoT]|uniref:hypothetical protein n=1 Tax=Singulisphaera sp. PoT TaxID=3411797 RepID=UPI003BF5EA1E